MPDTTKCELCVSLPIQAVATMRRGDTHPSAGIPICEHHAAVMGERGDWIVTPIEADPLPVIVHVAEFWLPNADALMAGEREPCARALCMLLIDGTWQTVTETELHRYAASAGQQVTQRTAGLFAWEVSDAA